uniref:Ig-like domain-containing protein n=1 Tax=Scophthalmus maximus TaxID=52904 RepID=A0A8D2ZHM8_SCOMX
DLVSPRRAGYCSFFANVSQTGRQEVRADFISVIVASAGETVILPCYINVSRDIPTVEWSKVGPELNIAFLYRDGCETFEMKNPLFRYRTNLNMNEVKNGDVSLRMSDVRPSDAGKYQCLILHTRNSHVAATFQVPGVGVTLQCEASGRSPQLEITFLDDQEKNISAGNLKRHQDPRGCVTVVRRVTVLTETNRCVHSCFKKMIWLMANTDAHVYITDTGNLQR